MPPGDDSGETRSATPTDQPGQTLDAGITPETAPIPVGSTPPLPSEPSPATPAASGAPPAKAGTPAPDDDPVRAAINRLARDGDDGQPRDDKGRFAPVEADKAPATPAKKSAPVATAAPVVAAAQPAVPVAPASPAGVDTDPYHGFDDRERAALKGRTRERIEELHHRWSEERKLRETAESKPAEPDEFSSMVTEHKLDEDVPFVAPQALATLVRAEAALTRSFIALQQGRAPDPNDVHVAGMFFQRTETIRGQLGLAPAPPAAATLEVKPFVGKLSDDEQALVEVYGLPEADVRMLAALRARREAAARTPSQAAAPVQPIQQAAPPRPTGIDFDKLYGQQLVSNLVTSGVQPAMVNAHIKVLFPLAAEITRTKFPGLAPEHTAGVFDALSAKDRCDILREAHEKYQAKTKPPVPARSTPPPPASHPTLNGSVARRAAASSTGDPVTDAVNLLARPG